MAIVLEKSAETAKIVLEKKKIFGELANVVAAEDFTGSMSTIYSSGEMQDTNDRVLAVAMNLSIDKSVNVYTFGNSGREIGKATPENYKNFVNREIYDKYDLEGSTKYAPVMKMIIEKYGNKKQLEKKSGFFSRFFKKENAEKTEKNPTIVFFFTDGANFDEDETERVIRDSSDQPIFWQFIGLGEKESQFKFLQKLDTMKGRTLDNANFFYAGNLSEYSDTDLYNRILEEYPGWLEQARELGIVTSKRN
jgi:hypothetical protein